MAIRKRLHSETGRSLDFVRGELNEVEQRLRVLDSIRAPHRTERLIEIASSSGSEFVCETCGLGFRSAEGRDMHVKHRRPEVHLGAGIPFSRREHALHGLPQCRFCRQLLFDFASLRKHVASGTCSTLKLAAARQTSPEALWQEVLDRERVDPPMPPQYLPVVLGEDSDSWLDAPLPAALNNDRLLRCAKHTCLLCGQRLIGMRRIKTHWRSSHAVAWGLTESYLPGAMRSLSSTFQTPCRYCDSNARSSEAHASQCYVTFQILAMRRLHQQDKLTEMRQIQSAIQTRQDKAKPAYASFDLSNTPIVPLDFVQPLVATGLLQLSLLQ